MPPRYAYWTIIAGGLPTAFRAAERNELMPTFTRIREKHPDAEMKWFARGKLWESPEAARRELAERRERRGGPGRNLQRPQNGREERAPGGTAPEGGRSGHRTRDWRPGGEHRDPRKKYADAKKARNLRHRHQKFGRKHGTSDAESLRPPKGPGTGRDSQPSQRGFRPEREFRPPTHRDGSPRHSRDWRDRPAKTGRSQAPRGDREPPFGADGSRVRDQRPWNKRPPTTHGRRDHEREWQQSRGERDGSRRENREWRDRPPKPARPQGQRREWDRPRERGGARPYAGAERDGYPRKDPRSERKPPFHGRDGERGQGTEEPPPPPRPRGPNREPRPSESPAPTPPPRPHEPAEPPGQPPERGRLNRARRRKS